MVCTIRQQKFLRLPVKMEHNKVVSSRNLFIDTRDGTGGKQNGDHCTISLGQTVHANDGEVIRLALKQFSMYSDFSPVNPNNSKFRLTTSASTTPVEGAIPSGWYETLYQLSEAFANTLQPLLVTAASAVSTVTQRRSTTSNPHRTRRSCRIGTASCSLPSSFKTRVPLR